MSVVNLNSLFGRSLVCTKIALPIATNTQQGEEEEVTIMTSHLDSLPNPEYIKQRQIQLDYICNFMKHSSSPTIVSLFSL